MTLMRIGFWSHGDDPGPNPHDFIDLGWDADERDWLADYLKHGMVARAYLGHASCAICGEPVGNLELSDGTYIWPEGLAHYVQTHRVRLPIGFINHAQRVADELENEAIDESWWVDQKIIESRATRKR